MCRLTNCCCCLDLRTGCIFISIVLFISAIANIVFAAVNASVIPSENVGGTIFGAIVAIGFWIVLFIGALMRNMTMIGVSMIALIFYIVGLALLLMLVIILGGIVEGPTQRLFMNEGFVYFLLIVIGFPAQIALFVYFVLVIQSFKLEILACGPGNLPYPNYR